MTTITISRQLGSRGLEIARQVAERLGYRLVWRELINQAALRAGAPEMALATIDELGLLNLCPSPAACRAYHQAVRQVMLELAEEGGVVILGRAGQVILRGRPDVLHVRLIAPAGLRAGRIAALQNISLEAAAAQVQASDRHRSNYLRRFYKARWDNPELYDLLLNTADLSVETAAGIIVQAAALRFNALPVSP
jgi:cytidylate kinase